MRPNLKTTIIQIDCRAMTWPAVWFLVVCFPLTIFLSDGAEFPLFEDEVLAGERFDELVSQSDIRVDERSLNAFMKRVSPPPPIMQRKLRRRLRKLPAGRRRRNLVANFRRERKKVEGKVKDDAKEMLKTARQYAIALHTYQYVIGERKSLAGMDLPKEFDGVVEGDIILTKEQLGRKIKDLKKLITEIVKWRKEKTAEIANLSAGGRKSKKSKPRQTRKGKEKETKRRYRFRTRRFLQKQLRDNGTSLKKQQQQCLKFKQRAAAYKHGCVQEGQNSAEIKCALLKRFLRTQRKKRNCRKKSRRQAKRRGGKSKRARVKQPPTRRVTPAARDSQHIWPNHRVPYCYESESLKTMLQANVRIATNYWQKRTCLIFEERAACQNDGEILIADSNGCHSFVGYQRWLQQIMSLSPHSCNTNRAVVEVRTVAHELGHAIGLHHEQVRGDRDHYVGITNYGLLNEGQWASRFGICSSCQYPTPYDYGSVMHYTPRANEYAISPVLGKDQNYANTMGSDPLGMITVLDAIDVNNYQCAAFVEVQFQTAILAQEWQNPCRGVAVELRYGSDLRVSGPRLCGMRYAPTGTWKSESNVFVILYKQAWTGSYPLSTAIYRYTTEANRPSPTVHQASGSASQCRDLNMMCNHWAQRVECTKNPVYMHQYCPVSCKIRSCQSSPSGVAHMAPGPLCQENADNTTNCVPITDSVSPEPTSLSASTDDCQDTHQLCQFWADINECSKNPLWMEPNCPVSCRMKHCAGVELEEIPVQECKDTHHLCEFWSKIGECSINKYWMIPNCPMSCNVTKCISGSTETDTVSSSPPTTPRPTTTPTTTVEEVPSSSYSPPTTASTPVDPRFSEACMDQDDSCTSMAEAGQCDNSSSGMQLLCPESCQIDRCRPSNAPFPWPSLYPTCDDLSLMCAQWAMAGECLNNPDYMLYNCRKSCTDASCSVDVAAKPEARDGCADGSDKCAAWADKHECAINPLYMLKSCEKSCYQCRPLGD